MRRTQLPSPPRLERLVTLLRELFADPGRAAMGAALDAVAAAHDEEMALAESWRGVARVVADGTPLDDALAASARDVAGVFSELVRVVVIARAHFPELAERWLDEAAAVLERLAALTRREELLRAAPAPRGDAARAIETARVVLLGGRLLSMGVPILHVMDVGIDATRTVAARRCLEAAQDGLAAGGTPAEWVEAMALRGVFDPRLGEALRAALEHGRGFDVTLRSLEDVFVAAALAGS